MKIEKINENKLRVIVPVSYFEERNIDFKNFDYTSDAAQKFFCELMEILENDYGFNFLNSQMIVESSFDHSDDVVFTLTSSQNHQDGMSILQKYLSKKRRSRLSNNQDTTNASPKNNVLIFEFQNFDDVCDMAVKLQDLCTLFNSLYKLNDNYYLMIDRNEIDRYRKLLASLNEFGQYVPNSSFYEGYLNEYGELIILGNALDVIKSYFVR